MVGWLVNSKLQRIWREVMLRRTEENEEEFSFYVDVDQRC